VIRPLIEQGHQVLEPGGIIAIEIGTSAQAQQVEALLNTLGFSGVRIRDDYAHTPRAVLGYKTA
jgi:methylase of polypeptide subunit release factors